MRLQKLNRVMMLAVSSTLAGMTASISGCKHQVPPQPAQQMPEAAIVRRSSNISDSMSSPTTKTSSTAPTTEPTTLPTTMATTQAVLMPTTVPASQPVAETPALVPATAPVVTPEPAAVPAPVAAPALAPVTVAPPETSAVPATPAAAPAIPPAASPTTAPTTAPVAVAVPPTPTAVLPPTVPPTAPATMPTMTPTAPPIVPTVPAAPPTKDVAAPTDPEEIEADAALAERIASIAELSFPSKVSNNAVWPQLWRQQAGLYSAATTLNPGESRYARLSADADAQAGDFDAEVKALYLATHAKPDDEFSWNKRLDLLLSRMQSSDADPKSQTAEAQLKYLRGVMDSKAVPVNVRAHAGFRAAQIMQDRGQDAAAATVVDESLRYDPSNIDCLKLRYAMLPATATRFERAGRLLDLLKANPLQWQYSAQVAEIAAGSGLTAQSLSWYMLAVGSAHQQGIAAQGAMLNLASALFIADRKLDALRGVSALLQIDPKFYPGYFLQLLVSRSNGDKDATAKLLVTANNALSNRLVEAVNAVAAGATNQPTTRPIDSQGVYPLPNLGPVVSKLKADANPQATRTFVESVADLARLQIYFAQQPDAAVPLLDALKDLLPENDPVLAQLQGWNDLLAKKPEEARAKLTSIAAEDPIAQLGLIKLMSADPANREQAESLSRKLLQDNPAGLIGAVLWEGLRSERVKLVLSPQATALDQELSQFPQSLFSVGEKPQNAYSIHATPLSIGRYLGDPLLVEITVQNQTDNDLTVGDDGLIKPQMLFTMGIRAGAKPMEFAAVDSLACPTSIRPHGYTRQVVRVDQSQMLATLSDPDSTTTAFGISGTLATNETAYRLGGYSSAFTKSFYRLASPVTPGNLNSTLSSLASGPAGQKMTSLTLLQLFVQKLQKVKNPDGGQNPAIPALMDALHKSRSDSNPAVAAWASKCEFELSDGENRIGVLKDMVEDADWRHRQLSLSLLAGVDETVRGQILARLVTDSQSSVRETAIAVQAIAQTPEKGPTTAPTTAPATAP